MTDGADARDPIPIADALAAVRAELGLPDTDAFPCLRRAYEAGRTGGAAPAVLSGANEVAVAAFLAGRIRWTAIADVVDEALAGGTGNVSEVDDVLDADRSARERAMKAVRAAA